MESLAKLLVNNIKHNVERLEKQLKGIKPWSPFEMTIKRNLCQPFLKASRTRLKNTKKNNSFHSYNGCNHIRRIASFAQICDVTNLKNSSNGFPNVSARLNVTRLGIEDFFSVEEFDAALMRRYWETAIIIIISRIPSVLFNDFFFHSS